MTNQIVSSERTTFTNETANELTPHAVVMAQLAQLVEWLADGAQQPCTRMTSFSDAARRVLRKMTELEIIEARTHPYTWGGPAVWMINGKLFGRTDGIDAVLFGE